MSKKVIFIVGPTASGKTDLSIALAKRFGGEIICADSMQIYKGIHIASACPDKNEMQGIPHHLFEFLELDEQFSVADYVKLARNKINEITACKKLPIVVGGTGLYISALLDNTEFCEEKTDESLRKSLEAEYNALGGEEMLKKLSNFDRQTAESLNPADKKRIVRAFEIFMLTGQTKSEQNAQSHSNAPDFDALVLGLTFFKREELYDRINRRVDLMLENGLSKEALETFGKQSSSGAFQAIGHKELYPYLKGECSLEEAAEILKQQTRRYAKRQLTWFRRDGRVNWLFADCDNVTKTAIQKTKDFL